MKKSGWLFLGVGAVAAYLYFKGKKAPVTTADLTNNKVAGNANAPVVPKPAPHGKMLASTEVNFAGSSNRPLTIWEMPMKRQMSQGDSTDIQKACRCADNMIPSGNDIPPINQ